MKRIALIFAFALAAHAAGPAPSTISYVPVPRVVWDAELGMVSVIQPNSYAAMLVSPSGSGTDWTPLTGTSTGAPVQPNTYSGLLVCTANCTSPYASVWGPWSGSGSGTSGITSINGDTTPAQTIVGGTNTTVSTTGGTTTISSTGGVTPASVNGVRYSSGSATTDTAATGPQLASALGSTAVQNANAVPASGVTGSLSPYNIPVIGPGAGSSTYLYGSTQTGTSIDTEQGFYTYHLPTPSTAIQVVFGNSATTGEVCGPKYSVRGAIEYPIDSGNYIPIFFNGNRDAVVSQCGKVISDPLYINTTAAVPFLQVRSIASRASGETSAFPAGAYAFTGIPTNSLGPLFTTTKGRVWSVEELNSYTSGGLTASCSAGSTSVTFNTIGSGGIFLQYAGQIVNIAGAGTSGSTFSTTIASLANATTATLSTACPLTVSAAAATITPVDKTTSGTITTGAQQAQTFSPVALYARPIGTVKTVGLCCDSISLGTGASSNTGSWSVQALNQAGVNAGYSTQIHTGIPYVNMSITGERVSNLVSSKVHTSRLGMLASTKNVLALVSTNDTIAGTAAATTEANIALFATQIRQSGPTPYFATVIPLSTSSDGWLTLSGQTTGTNNAIRVAINNWIRDGAPTDCVSGLAVATGSSTPTTARTTYYSTTGTVVTPGSIGSGCASTFVHPMGGTYELADIVESARDSGLWKVDANVRTVTGCSITASTTALTCTGGNFTSADTGVVVSVAGAGTSGANLVATFTYTSATTGTMASSAVTTVAAANALVDGGPTTSTTSGRYTTGDGIHPSFRGHRLMGVDGATQVANFNF